MRPLVVVDANVWIDFCRMALLEPFATLPYAFCSPEEVVDELYPQQQELLLALPNFRAVPVDPQGWQMPKKFSVADRCVMGLARQEGAQVWSNEKLMRQLGSQWGLTVRGTLGVLDELVQGRHCTPAQATGALHTLLRGNAYLPKNEAFALLDRWSQDQG